MSIRHTYTRIHVLFYLRFKYDENVEISVFFLINVAILSNCMMVSYGLTCLLLCRIK